VSRSPSWVFAISAALAASVIVASTAAAQRFELGATLGYRMAVRHQFASYAYSDFGAMPGWQHLTGFHEGDPDLGLHATLWRRPRLGLQLVGSVWRTLRTVEQEQVSLRFSTSDRVTVVSLAVRMVVRLGTAPRRHVDLALGPQLTHFGGPGYESTPTAFLAIRHRMVVGASGGIAYAWPVRPRLHLRLALDAAAYRAPLVAAPDSGTTKTRIQLDVAPSVALVLSSR
jgi:hypothetical protein